MLLFSCDGNAIFSEFEHFDDNRWFRNDVQLYEMTIDQSGSYDVLLNFSHVYNAPLPEIPIDIVIEHEAEEIVKESTVIKFVNNGSAISDCTGDICDLTQVVIKAKSFATGKYTIKLSQSFQSDYLPNVIGVGISLQSADQN